MRRFVLLLLSVQLTAATPEELEFFESEIRPLLVKECYSCHSASAPTISGGMRLDSREGLIKGGESGPAIRPGDPAASRLVSLLKGKPVLMPPTGRLPEDRIAALSKWIETDAPWPKELKRETDASDAFDIEARKRSHWAWKRVEDVSASPVHDSAWPRNDVDRFLLRKLEAKGMRPAEPAGRHTLVRRLTFDLTGLPPTPAEIKSFVDDESPNAFEKLVRRLLDSTHFGERWARHWMDLVRYTETHGSEGDPAIPDAWRYRDYLIRAFNADVGYDQLIREHLAGDLLDAPRINESLGINESILGVAHLRMVEHSYQPIDPWEDRVKWTDNQVDVISKTFQGLTVSCARCHHHKFDAISQEDYYSLFGILYGARPTQRAIDAPDSLNLHRDELGHLKEEIKNGFANEWLLAADDVLTDEDSWSLTKALEEGGTRRLLNRDVQDELQPKVREVLRQGEFNDFVIRGEDNRIRAWINGVAFEYVDTDEKLAQEMRKGTIGFQLHNGPPQIVSVKGGVNLDRFGGAKIDHLGGSQWFSWDGWNGARGRPLGRPRRNGRRPTKTGASGRRVSWKSAGCSFCSV
jgi:hypothetical protein